MIKTRLSIFTLLWTLLILPTTALAEGSLERINCKKPTTQAYKLICNDPHLKSLAVRMAKSFSGLRQRLIDQAKPALDLEQKAWTVFRDSDCDTAFNKPFKGPQKRPKRLCLTRHFEARLLTLEGRLKTLGSSRVSKSANLRKATKLLPFGSYHLTAQHGTKSQVTANLTFDSDRIVLGDKLCLSPSIQPYGVENYFFFKNNFGIKDPGLFGWSNRSGARSLALEVRCGAGDLGYASVFLVGKPGTLGLMIDKSTFLTFKKQ